jgi:hypothetical protein
VNISFGKYKEKEKKKKESFLMHQQDGETSELTHTFTGSGC